MAKDLYDAGDLAKKSFQEASDMMGLDLSKLCFEGPIEKLTETDVTQPAVFVHSYIVNQLAKEKGLTADVVAGHSLGEFSALVAAGVLSFSDALNIVVKRGRLMKECNEKTEGTMAAIMKFDIDQIRQACEEVDDVVQVANYNSDAQIVISGSVNGVHQAMELIKSKGARIVKELQVGGAFHSPLMKPAEDELAKIINATEYKDASTDVYPNVTAKATRSGSELKSLSIKQLTATVLWYDTLLNMHNDSVSQMVELGPGNVLSGIAKRLPFELDVKAVGTLEEINQL
ncbi:MAG: ACP S-malonyltransferase [Calditrichaeota bacterium]|nr:ACP S-malonyltransferase [Calditrichota bacterium]